MVKKKKMAKNANVCEHYWKHMVLAKLSVISFILFLVTVWSGAMNLVHSIHWVWFLAAWIVFGAFAMKHTCC
jgi:hypothetical protein